MRRRQIIGDAGFRSSRDRQREINWSLSRQPNSGRSLSVTKENEARYVWPGDFRRKRCDLFIRKSAHESRLCQRTLAEKVYRLLPFAFACDVCIIAAAKRKDRQRVTLVVIVMAQPAPGLIVSAGKLFERCRPKLRMRPEEADDFHRVHVADGTRAAAPRVTITVGQDQIPPQLHLLFKRRAHRIENVFSIRGFGGFPNEPRILVRVAIKATGRRIVVRIDSAIHERPRGASDHPIDQPSILQQAELIADAGDARRDAEIVFRKINYLLRLRIVESRNVEPLAPLRALLFAETLPDRIRV